MLQKFDVDDSNNQKDLGVFYNLQSLSLVFSLFISFSAIAESISLIGPDGRQSLEVVKPQQSVEQKNTRYYGPTTRKETLWGVATRLRPNDSISLYKVIGAIYASNPQSFDGGSIHRLKPGSLLLIPSLSDIKQQSINQVRDRLANDTKSDKSAQKPVNNSADVSSVTSLSTPIVDASVQTTIDASDNQVTMDTSTLDRTARSDLDAKSNQPISSQLSIVQSKNDAIEKKKDTDSTSVITPKKPQPLVAIQSLVESVDEQAMNELIRSNHRLQKEIIILKQKLSVLVEESKSDALFHQTVKQFLIEAKERHHQETIAAKAGLFDNTSSVHPIFFWLAAIIPSLIVGGGLWWMLIHRQASLTTQEAPLTSDIIPSVVSPSFVSEIESEQVVEPESINTTPEQTPEDVFFDDLFDDASLVDDSRAATESVPLENIDDILASSMTEELGLNKENSPELSESLKPLVNISDSVESSSSLNVQDINNSTNDEINLVAHLDTVIDETNLVEPIAELTPSLEVKDTLPTQSQADEKTDSTTVMTDTESGLLYPDPVFVSLLSEQLPLSVQLDEREGLWSFESPADPSIPKGEEDIWRAPADEVELETENWETQSPFDTKDIVPIQLHDFDEKEERLNVSLLNENTEERESYIDMKEETSHRDIAECEDSNDALSSLIGESEDSSVLSEQVLFEKWELAQAYLDMDDEEGVFPLLKTLAEQNQSAFSEQAKQLLLKRKSTL